MSIGIASRTLTPTAEPDIERIIPLLSFQGRHFEYVRLDLSWQAIEPEPGKYEWGRFDRLVDIASRVGLKVIFVVGYGNIAHTGGPYIPPLSDSARKPFQEWLTRAVDRYRSSGPVWEIWNEPNYGHTWPGGADPVRYAQVVQLAADSIRSSDIHACIVAGSTLGAAIGFLRDVAKNIDLRKYVDSWSIHPYSDPQDSDLTNEISAVAETVSKIGISLVITEWGVFIGSNRNALSVENARATIEDRINKYEKLGVRLLTYYVLRDYGSDPRNKEHNFGILSLGGCVNGIANVFSLRADDLPGLKCESH